MMRAFSSDIHRSLIATLHRRPVESVSPWRASLAIVGWGIVLGGVLLAGVAAFPALSMPTGSAQEGAIQSSTPSATTMASMPLPSADVPGDDIAGLPRYPDSVRSDHEVALDGEYRLTVTEYLAAATVDEVRAFYQGVISAQGWERADIGFTDGEWSYALVDGSKLALIEIEQVNNLVEVDLQVSEPVVASTPAPSPAATAAPPPRSPAPTAAPPPPPQLPGEDDGDDDDDDAGDD